MAVGVAALAVTAPAAKINPDVDGQTTRSADERNRGVVRQSNEGRHLTAVAGAAPVASARLTGEQVYRHGARLLARYLRTQLRDLPRSDPWFRMIAEDVTRFQSLADGGTGRTSRGSPQPDPAAPAERWTGPPPGRV